MTVKTLIPRRIRELPIWPSIADDIKTNEPFRTKVLECAERHRDDSDLTDAINDHIFSHFHQQIKRVVDTHDRTYLITRDCFESGLSLDMSIGLFKSVPFELGIESTVETTIDTRKLLDYLQSTVQSATGTEEMVALLRNVFEGNKITPIRVIKTTVKDYFDNDYSDILKLYPLPEETDLVLMITHQRSLIKG